MGAFAESEAVIEQLNTPLKRLNDVRQHWGSGRRSEMRTGDDDVVVSPVWMTVLVSYKTKPSTIMMAMMPPTMAPPLQAAARVGPE